MKNLPDKADRTIRCAIYTRKSSEEGLEQNFNSLDAQRDACASYIKSQAGEGWVALPEIYDDGGLSGGTLDRPALRRLLADVDAGRVDLIVVYKVDRLTRSLFDFAKLVERFDKTQTSFVSVTQAFNTANSMGRLTLNMLLSFAQFEREVTSERIRDKIAASKARGLWMGGVPPLGYRPAGRTLEIVESEAEIVRDIFERYLRLGTARLVMEDLVRDEVRSPERIAINGRCYGNTPLSRGQIYAMLRNPVYVGKIAHKKTAYPGLHEPIIAVDVWDRVQARLAANLQGGPRKSYSQTPSLLAGIVFDEVGAPFGSSHATKGTARYRYYVSQTTPLVRIPARELDVAITETVMRIVGDPVALAAQCGLALESRDLARLSSVRRSATIGTRKFVRSLVDRVEIKSATIELTLATAAVASHLDLQTRRQSKPTFTVVTDARLTRSGRVVKLVQASGDPVVASPNTALAKLLTRAHHWWSELRKGEIDVTTLAAAEGVTPSYLTRVVRVAFLAPSVASALLAGRHPVGLGPERLTMSDAIASRWDIQEAELLGRQTSSPSFALPSCR